MPPHSPIRFGSVAYRSPSCSGNVAEPMRKKHSFSHPFRASSSRSGAAAPADAVNEIQRYKALLDAGVLTEEEFVAKKRQLLGI